VKEYRVTIAEPIFWTWFCPSAYVMKSESSIQELSATLFRKGFSVEGGKKWIMPGAIISIEQL
jgi:hypothetical protein